MKIIEFLLLAFFCFSIYSQTNFSNDKKIAEILSRLPEKNNRAILIFDPETKDTIYKENIFKQLIPASNTKIFTTAAVYHYLGKNYTINTQIRGDKINKADSILKGNLYLKGYGNGIFTTEQLDAMINDFLKTGIKNIEGNVIGDDTFFDSLYSRKDWIEEERSMLSLPPVSALNLNRNEVIITLEPDRYTGKVNIATNPEGNFIKIINNVKLSGLKSKPKISTAFNGGVLEIYVSGSFWKKSRSRSYSIYVSSPPLFASSYLYHKLINLGIKISGIPAIGETPQNTVVYAEDKLPVKEMLSIINKRSNNFLAECLFKIIGAEFVGGKGNSFYSAQAINSMIEDLDISGGTSLVDGSGISRGNLTTAASICGLLENIYFNDSVYEDFYNTLSVAGNDGTLADRKNNRKYNYIFHGKTGTLRGVSSLSGYLSTEKGNELIVSIIFNFTKGSSELYKNTEDLIIEYLAETK